MITLRTRSTNCPTRPSLQLSAPTKNAGGTSLSQLCFSPTKPTKPNQTQKSPETTTTRRKHHKSTATFCSNPNPPFGDPGQPPLQRLTSVFLRQSFVMYRDVSACNSYNYGDALYWDARYIQEGGTFDWYQRYSALRPFVRKYIPTASRVLMVGCGNAVMSEDMVMDGYQDIMNVDISSVAIDMMRRKYEELPQLKYMQMDVRDMSFFPDDSFGAVIDKGTLDSLMCGTDAPISAAQMMGEVSRLLKPGGVYMMITYGDPTVRIPHLCRPAYDWKIELYIIPRPGFQKVDGSTSSKDYLESVPISEKGTLPADFVMEDPDSHFIYVCTKTTSETTAAADSNRSPAFPYTSEVL